MIKTLGGRVSEIAYALGHLQDQARQFTETTTTPGNFHASPTQLLAEAAVEFTESVRRTMRPRGKRR